MDTPGTTIEGDGNTYEGGAYLGAMYERFYLSGAVRYGYNTMETQRYLDINGERRSFAADFEGSEIAAFLEGAYRLDLASDWDIEPVISLAYDHMTQDAFAEETDSDIASLALSIDELKFDSLQTNIGVQAAVWGRDDDGRYMKPSFRILYEREWLDNDRDLDGHFAAAGDLGAYEVIGASLPRNRAVIGVTSDVGITELANLFLDYDFRVGKGLLEHSLAIGFRILF